MGRFEDVLQQRVERIKRYQDYVDSITKERAIAHIKDYESNHKEYERKQLEYEQKRQSEIIEGWNLLINNKEEEE